MLPTPLAIEQAGLKAWPGIEVEWDGHWVRRAANGYSKRANSVQCFDAADDANVAERVVAARRWFETRGLTPVFRLNLLSGPLLVAELDRQGWAQIDHSHLFAMPMPVVDVPEAGRTFELLDPVFLDALQRLTGDDDHRRTKLTALLAAVTVPGRGIVLYSDFGEPVAASLVTMTGGILYTGNVITDPAQRRKGHGSAMMKVGLEWGRAHGATTAALNVAADNRAGQALYRALGYERLYDYVYRVPGTA
ncbi:MAG: GNAT family N-acetyltransferase [Devosia sp.]